MTTGLKELAKTAERYHYSVASLGWGITVTDGLHTLRLQDDDDLQAICENAHHMVMGSDLDFSERHKWMQLVNGFWAAEARYRERMYHEQNRSKLGRPAPQEELPQ